MNLSREEDPFTVKAYWRGWRAGVFVTVLAELVLHVTGLL